MSTAPRRISRPAASPAQGGPSLADRVAAEAEALRGRGDELARFCADELDRLARLVGLTRARSPQEHRDRLEAWDRDLSEDQARAAYAQGYDHGRRDGRDLAFDEITVVLKRSVGLR